MARPRSSLYLLGFLAILLGQCMYLYAHFPALEQYHPAADEGTYFRQAVTVLDNGVSGLRVLGDDFVANPAAQIFPNPLRVGHLLLATTAVGIRRSFSALSVLSLACHAALSILAFVFVRRWSGEPAAFGAALLVTSSPFGSAAARRALMDAEYCLFALLAVFIFVTWAMNGRWRTFVWFLVALTWAALVKETTLFLVPAFAAAIVLASVRRTGTVAWRHLAALLLVPMVVAVTYAALFGGMTRAVDMARITREMNQPDTNEYIRLYQSGPWSSFFVDNFLLAPVATLAFLFLWGWYLTRRVVVEPMTILLVLFWVGFATFSLMPQDPRYTLPLETIARLFTGIAIAGVAATARPGTIGRLAAAGALAVMMVADTIVFHQVFLQDEVYDPVTYNLAVSRRVINSPPAPRTLSADDYLNLSVAYYGARDFDAAIEASTRGLRLRPDDAAAYNNIGVSYNALGRWADAIPPLQTALRLKPDFSLARNNLRWAETELAKSR